MPGPGESTEPGTSSKPKAIEASKGDETGVPPHEHGHVTKPIVIHSRNSSKKRINALKSRGSRRKSFHVGSVESSNAVKEPVYVEYHSNYKSKAPKIRKCTLNWFIDTLFSCDCIILPAEVQYYLQAHPKLTFCICFSLMLSIVLVTVAVGYMYHSLYYNNSRTFSVRALTVIFCMPGYYSKSAVKKPIFQGIVSNNCTIYQTEHYHKYLVGVPFVAIMCLVVFVPVQTAGLVFLMWKSFKTYTYQIAVVGLKLQSSFLLFAFVKIIYRFCEESTTLRSRMKDEMSEVTIYGISNWWKGTQEDLQCCGLDKPLEWAKVLMASPTTGGHIPISCLKEKSSEEREPTDFLKPSEAFASGCYETEKSIVNLYGSILIVSVVWIIVVSMGLIYLFDAVEILTRRAWKKTNSTFDTQSMSVETFGTAEIVSLDGTKYYSMLEIKNTDFNPFTDGIYDFKYDYEYDIEFQRGEIVLGKAVVETPNFSDRTLKLELEFDETKGLVTMAY